MLGAQPGRYHHFRLNPACAKEFTRFERHGIWAATVLIASSVGSQISILELLANLLILLGATQQRLAVLSILERTPTWIRTLEALNLIIKIELFGNNRSRRRTVCVPTSGRPTNWTRIAPRSAARLPSIDFAEVL